MTDNEIMTTLRRCADYACYRCTEYGKQYCNRTVAALAWDLMYRQNAEIEEYQKHIDNDIIYVKQVKSEAIKEFAERLKEHFEVYTDDEESNAIYVRNLIDSIAKEMTENSHD